MLIHEGKLTKRGIRRKSSWKTRYFKLWRRGPQGSSNSPVLEYFAKKSSKEAKGQLFLGIGSTVKLDIHACPKSTNAFRCQIYHDFAAEETEIAKPFDQARLLRVNPKIQKKRSKRLETKLKKKKKQAVSELVCYADNNLDIKAWHKSIEDEINHAHGSVGDGGMAMDMDSHRQKPFIYDGSDDSSDETYNVDQFSQPEARPSLGAALAVSASVRKNINEISLVGDTNMLSSVRRGLLWKKSSTKWKSKWFVLEGTSLLYYDNITDCHKNPENPKRRIELVKASHVCTISKMPPDKKTPKGTAGFTLANLPKSTNAAKQRYNLCANSAYERDEWVTFISKVIALATQADAAEIGRYQTPTTSAELKRSWSKRRLSAKLDSPSLLASLASLGSSSSPDTQTSRNTLKPRPLSGRVEDFDDYSAASAVGAGSGVDVPGADSGGGSNFSSHATMPVKPHPADNFNAVPTASPSSEKRNASVLDVPPPPATPDPSPYVRKAARHASNSVLDVPPPPATPDPSPYVRKAARHASNSVLDVPPPPATPDPSPYVRKAASRKKITATGTDTTETAPGAVHAVVPPAGPPLAEVAPPEVNEDRAHGTSPTPDVPLSGSSQSYPQWIDPGSDSTDDDYTKAANEAFDPIVEQRKRASLRREMMNLQQKQMNKEPAPVKVQERTGDVVSMQPIVEQQKRYLREMMRRQKKKINKEPAHIEEQKKQKRLDQTRLEIESPPAIQNIGGAGVQTVPVSVPLYLPVNAILEPGEKVRHQQTRLEGVITNGFKDGAYVKWRPNNPPTFHTWTELEQERKITPLEFYESELTRLNSELRVAAIELQDFVTAQRLKMEIQRLDAKYQHLKPKSKDAEAKNSIPDCVEVKVRELKSEMKRYALAQEFLKAGAIQQRMESLLKQAPSIKALEALIEGHVKARRYGEADKLQKKIELALDGVEPVGPLPKSMSEPPSPVAQPDAFQSPKSISQPSTPISQLPVTWSPEPVYQPPRDRPASQLPVSQAPKPVSQLPEPMYHPPKHVMQLPVSQLPEPVYKPPESLELLQMRIKDYMIAGRNDKAQEVACKLYLLNLQRKQQLTTSPSRKSPELHNLENRLRQCVESNDMSQAKQILEQIQTSKTNRSVGPLQPAQRPLQQPVHKSMNQTASPSHHKHMHQTAYPSHQPAHHDAAHRDAAHHDAAHHDAAHRDAAHHDAAHHYTASAQPSAASSRFPWGNYEPPGEPPSVRGPNLSQPHLNYILSKSPSLYDICINGDVALLERRLQELGPHAAEVLNKPHPKFGSTPMHGAAWRIQMDCVKMLIKYGARTDVKNNKGHTAHEEASIGTGASEVLKNFFDSKARYDFWSKNN